jgi:hypothetical protein
MPGGGGAAAAAAQPDGVRCQQLTDEDTVHDAMAPARPHAPVRDRQLQNPPRMLPSSASDEMTAANTQSRPKMMFVGTADVQASDSDVAAELSRWPVPGQCANSPLDAPPAAPEQAAETPCPAGDRERQHFLPADVEVDRQRPAHLSTEGDTKEASSQDEGTGWQCKRPLEAACSGGQGARSDQGEPFSSRSVVDMFASLHCLQGVMDSDRLPEGTPCDASQPMLAFIPACGPARKKRRADTA